MTICKFQRKPETPCVIVHGDYCYGAQLVTNLPICNGCARGPDETGILKPKGFDAMIAWFLTQQTPNSKRRN